MFGVARSPEWDEPLLTAATWLGLMAALAGAAQPSRDVAPAAQRTPALSRVIALAPNAAEIICSLGACDTLVGVSRFCTYPPSCETFPKSEACAIPISKPCWPSSPTS